MSACMYVCMHVCVCVCMYVYRHGHEQRQRRRLYTVVYACMYVCMCVDMAMSNGSVTDAHTFIHTYMHKITSIVVASPKYFHHLHYIHTCMHAYTPIPCICVASPKCEGPVTVTWTPIISSIFTCIHSFIRSYIHTYTHACTRSHLYVHTYTPITCICVPHPNVRAPWLLHELSSFQSYLHTFIHSYRHDTCTLITSICVASPKCGSPVTVTWTMLAVTRARATKLNGASTLRVSICVYVCMYSNSISW
jgi:hypothetical protein